MLNFRFTCTSRHLLAAGFLVACSVFACCSASPTPNAPAPTVRKPVDPSQPIDAEAQKICAAMTAAYQALQRFSVTISTQAQQTPVPNALPQISSFSMNVLLKKPNQALVVIKGKNGETRVVMDGTNLFAVKASSPSEYARQPLSTDDKVLINTMLFAGEFSGEGMPGLGPLVVTGFDLMDLLTKSRLKSLSVGDAATIEGVPTDTVVAVLNNPAGDATCVFSIGKNDHLLHRMTFETSSKEKGTEKVTEEHSEIKINPEHPEQAFVFTPPPGAKEMAAPAQPANYDQNLKPGAEPLPIKATDLSGKPVTLDQYKGKVVLVDFWATWCGPCRAEVPNVAAAYKKYKDQGFDVLGVSLDNADAKAALVEYTKKNNMTWRQIYDGKGWSSDISTQYQVRAIPFAMLLGRDGKIAAVNVRGPALEPAIVQELAKK